MRDLGLLVKELERKGFEKETASSTRKLSFQRVIRESQNLILNCEYDTRNGIYSFAAIPIYIDDPIPTKIRRDVKTELSKSGIRVRIEGNTALALEDVRTRLGLDHNVNIGSVNPVVEYVIRISTQDTNFKRGYSTLVQALGQLGYKI